MITGRVDDYGRALIVISIQSAIDGSTEDVDVWIDTGFTGDLVLPESLVSRLGLAKSAAVPAYLADGAKTLLETYSCSFDWFGSERSIEVIASHAQTPLLGVGLLLGRRVIVDYGTLAVSIE